MPIRILIADDHAGFRAAVRALLETEVDLEVVGEAEDGPSAIEAVASQDVDVLLLDVVMPGLHGPQIAEAVLKKQPGLAIVVLSMHDDELYVRDLLRIGARAFVLKQSAGTELPRAIRSAHAAKEFIDPAITARRSTLGVHWPQAGQGNVAPTPHTRRGP